MSTEPLLTVADIAVMFGRAVGTVEHWRLHDQLPAPDVMLGRTPGWRRAGLLRWGRETGRLMADGTPVPAGRPRQPARVG
jgi:hypothetical protein